ncbi:MAG TPA: hypothetical protein PKA54_04265 [Chitinophagaceae bacterium]|nr:hypothetical protein [Chitinophagaceae bacterium]
MPFIVFSQKYKKRTAEEKARFYTDEMIKELSLDSATSQKVFGVNLYVSKKFDSLYATTEGSDDKRKGAVFIYKKRDSLFKEVLSKKEYLKYDDLQREKREKKKTEAEKLKND